MIDFQNGSYVKLSELDISQVGDDIRGFLLPGEVMERAFRSMRDSVIFTNLRIIAVNVQGLTGKKKDYTSLPYSKFTAFSVETSGVFDLDSELEIYLSGVGKVKFEFTGQTDICEIGRLIANKSLQ